MYASRCIRYPGFFMRPAPPALYLSLVAACEDTSPAIVARAQRFVDSWIEQAQHYRIQSELVLVACTAPGTLSGQLRSPNQGPCELVCIEVPNELLIRPNRAAPPRYVRRILRNMGIR